MGIGDVFLETSIGTKLVLKDVPDIRLNLISTGRLDDEGFTNSFGESKWKLTKGSLVVERGKKQNTLYVMEAKLHKGEINVAQRDVSIELGIGFLVTSMRKDFKLLLESNSCQICMVCLLKLVIIV